MIKKILALILVGLLLLTGIYIFIPTKLTVSKNVIIHCSINGANRFLLNEHKWVKWWPGHSLDSYDTSTIKKKFNHNGYSFTVSHSTYNRISINASKNNIRINTILNIFPLSKDSIITQWQCSFTSSINPIKRIAEYHEARNIKETMTDLLFNLKFFLDKKSNVYGVDINEIISKDSTLVAIKLVTSNYPATQEIYLLVKKLHNYIEYQKAIETNYPMLNVKKTSDNKFETMVAIPVNKKLEGQGQIFPSRFVPWKTMTAVVEGGNWTIKQATQQMQLFIQDYNRTPYAISFESLITDRSLQPDTLKWISKICQAVS